MIRALFFLESLCIVLEEMTEEIIIEGNLCEAKAFLTVLKRVQKDCEEIIDQIEERFDLTPFSTRLLDWIEEEEE